MRYQVLVLALLLGACATTGTGEKGIAIETTSNQQVISGANCVVSNNSGNWNVVTPAIVDVGAANGDLRVLCNKAGFRTSEFVFRPTSHTTGSSFGIGLGNVGRHTGVGVGMNFPIGGIGRSGSYPSKVTVEMSPQ